MEKSDVSVLIVDDNEMNLDMLSRRLANEEYVIQVTNSGEDAIKVLEIEQFDIILLDIMMPGVNGYEVLKWIKSKPLHSETEVLMLTALNDRASVVKSIELGAVDYLTKPFNLPLVKIRMWKCLHNLDRQKRHNGQFDISDAQVLVVDDDEMNRDILSRRLKKMSCHVDVAGDGLQALNKLTTKPYHLVLLDINMPGMSGVEVLKSMKDNSDIANTAVVMVSANNEESVQLECMMNGAIDFISKPYNSIVLRSRLEPIIRSALLGEVEKERKEYLKSLAESGADLKN